MSNKLAPTTFATGVNDQLAVTDRYKAKGGVSINSITELTHASVDIISNLIQSLSGNTPGILSNLAGQVTVSKNSLMTRLFANNASIKAAFAGMSDLSQANVLGKLDYDKDLSVTVNGIASTVDGANFDRVTGLQDISQRLTGVAVVSITDNTAKASFISGLVKEANQLGIQGSLTSFLTGVTDNGLINNIIQKSLPDLVRYGDLTSITSLINSSIGKSLVDIYPGFAQDLAKAFNLKYKSDGTLDLVASYDSLLNILDLTHPGWNKFEREGGIDEGYSIVQILSGSADNKRTFQQGGLARGTGRHRYHAMVGTLRQRTVAEDTRRLFGQVVPSTAAVMQVNGSGKVSKNTTNDAVVNKALQAIGLLGVLVFS